MSRVLGCAAAVLLLSSLYADEPRWWADDVEEALVAAKGNRPQIEKALREIPVDERKGMAFLVVNMPEMDLTSLSADFLKTNSALAHKAHREMPWGKAIPEDLFFNNVLAYANVDEKRDPWRAELYDLCMPIVKDCKTPAEAGHKINAELFKQLKLRYRKQDKAPNYSPKESIANGTASCTGLSIVLSDACRSVCVPARVVGTPNWIDKRGNHTWVELWDGDWHFTGACEASSRGLDVGWFTGIAAQAQKDSVEHAIYAASFRKTDTHFPLVWARRSKAVSAENVTDRYAKKKTADTFRLAVRVVNADKTRVARAVQVTAVNDANVKFVGKSHDESHDTNDFLSFDVLPGRDYAITVGDATRTVTAGKAGERQVVDFVVK